MKTLFKIVTVLFLKGVGAIFAFVFHVYISRTVAMKPAGDCFYFISMITILSVLARGGTDQLAVKYMAIAYKQKSQLALLTIVKRLFLTVLTGGILVGFSLFIFAQLLPVKLNIGVEYIYVAILIIPLFSFFFLNTEMLKSLQRPGLSQLLQNASIPCVFLLLSVTNFLFFIDRLEILYGISVFLCFFALFFVVRKRILTVENVNRAVLNTPRFSIPFMAISTSAVIFNWGGVFFLGILSDPASIAKFNAINRISIVVIFVSVAVNSIFAPKFAVQSFEKDKKTLQKSIFISFLCSVVISFFVCLVIIIFSDKILCLFGSEYVGIKKSLVVLCLSYAINSSFGTLGSFIMMAGYEKYLQWISYGTVFLYLFLVVLMSNFSLTEYEMAIIILFVFTLKSIVLAVMSLHFFSKETIVL